MNRCAFHAARRIPLRRSPVTYSKKHSNGARWPSWDPVPSKADFKFTERLVELAKVAEIRLLDHLVLGDGNYTSIRSLEDTSFD